MGSSSRFADAWGRSRPNPAVEAELREKKKATRKEVKEALRELSAERRAEDGAAIASRLLATLPCFRVGASDDEREDKRFALYVPCEKLMEVDATPIIDAALRLPYSRVYVPVVDGAANAEDDTPPRMRFLRVTDRAKDLVAKELFKGVEILEPTETTADGAPREDVMHDDDEDVPLDYIVVPGMAFTPNGDRLGRGGGFYDAFLTAYERRCKEKQWTTPTLIGLSFTEQILLQGTLPVGARDVGMDVIFTPNSTATCTSKGIRLVTSFKDPE